MERCEQHLRLKSYDGNCPDCVIDREVGKVGEAAGKRIAELESKLSSALEERDVLKAGQAAAQATHERMLAQAADADEQIKALSSRLDASIAEAVRVTVELGYDHWLKHGTPIRKQDAQLVALDVQRAIGVEKQPPNTAG